MKRLVELLVVAGIAAAVFGASMLRGSKFNGSWGAEPDAEAAAILEECMRLEARFNESRDVTRREVIRSSQPRSYDDPILGRRVKVMLVELVEHFGSGTHYGEGWRELKSRRYRIVLVFAGGKLLRQFAPGYGPMCYRQDFGWMASLR